jgi:hypothetical protein
VKFQAAPGSVAGAVYYIRLAGKETQNVQK